MIPTTKIPLKTILSSHVNNLKWLKQQTMMQTWISFAHYSPFLALILLLKRTNNLSNKQNMLASIIVLVPNISFDHLTHFFNSLEGQKTFGNSIEWSVIFPYKCHFPNLVINKKQTKNISLVTVACLLFVLHFYYLLFLTPQKWGNYY